MVQYIIQIIAFQVFFLLVYDVFLKKETFFNWNRFYLIVTSLLSLILPFVKVTAFKEIVSKNYIVTLPEVFIGNKTISNAEVILPEVEIAKQGFSWSIETIFYLGLIVASLLFIFKISHILLLIYKNPKRWKGNVLLVKLINSTSAFSFFHYVFLGSNLKEEEEKIIIKHELVHVTQKHTLDLLFFEIQRIVFWFNPLVYMYQGRIRSLHEFIADQEALKTQNKSDYYQNLLTQVFDTQNVSFINAFFKKSLIKKRIIMLSKSKSKQVLKFKYALLIPLVFGMLMYSSSYAQDNKVSNETTQEISDKELKEKLYAELKELKENSENKYKALQKFHKRTDKYIPSKEEYYRTQIYFLDILKLTDDITGSDRSTLKSLKDKLERTYEEFLEWKKTGEAKGLWENNAYNGTLRLVVNDIKKLTVEEKEEESKRVLLFKDDFFKKLIVTDGYSSYSLDSKKYTLKETETVMIDKIEVPYASIEQPPMFQDCETLPEEEQRKCTSDAITKHVQKNFNTNLANDLGLSGRQTIRVVFKIDKEGNIASVVARAPHPKLEEEAKRVIKSLPKMIPGKQKGKAVIVPYSLPIIFQIADKTDKKTTQQETIMIDEVEVPFAVIEQPPMFEDCETLSKEEQRKCTSDIISKHVQKNFNTDLAGELGLTGRQTIRAMFKINKEGNIEGVMVRAPHPKLEEEVKRVIESLPKMIPGKQKGEAVIVPYSLPIIFQVADSETNTNFQNDVIEKKQENIEVPFALIDELPIYPGCENITEREELKKCTVDGISKFILNEFGKKLPKNLDLLPRQKIPAMFKISKTGDVEAVRAMSAHPELEKEAIRVLKLLPKMTPGKHKGKTVVAAYTIPIIYELGEKKN